MSCKRGNLLGSLSPDASCGELSPNWDPTLNLHHDGNQMWHNCTRVGFQLCLQSFGCDVKQGLNDVLGVLLGAAHVVVINITKCGGDYNHHVFGVWRGPCHSGFIRLGSAAPDLQMGCNPKLHISDCRPKETYWGACPQMLPVVSYPPTGTPP